MFSFIKNKLKEIFYLDEPEPIDIEKGCHGLESICKFSGTELCFGIERKTCEGCPLIGCRGCEKLQECIEEGLI